MQSVGARFCLQPCGGNKTLRSALGYNTGRYEQAGMEGVSATNKSDHVKTPLYISFAGVVISL
jgi:hypothetical protein